MEWADIWKIILCAVGSAGGVGAIIVGAVRFSSNIIADRLSQKYEAKLQKELEQYKAKLDGKNYITKAQYDAEFSIYRTLSKNFFEMLLVLNGAFSSDYRFEQTFNPQTLERVKSEFINAATKIQAAQDTLYENAAFISKPLYDKYEQILDEAPAVFWEYKEKLYSDKMREIVEDSTWLDEKHKCVKKLEDMLFALNDNLRTYLQGLTIVE